MLTGKDPFHNAVSIFELIQAHVATPPPTMRSVDPATTVPAKLEQVVLKAMAKEPINRFQNATEMLNAIIDACSGMSEREAGELRLLSDSGKNRGSASQVSLPTVQSEATQPVEPGTPTAGASKVSAAELDSIPTPAKLPGPGLRQALSTPDPKTAWQSPKQQPTAPVDPGMRNRAIREFPSEQPKASNLLIAAAPIVLGIGLIAASLAVIVPHFMQTSHSQGAPISTPAQNAASGGEKATASDDSSAVEKTDSSRMSTTSETAISSPARGVSQVSLTPPPKVHASAPALPVSHQATQPRALSARRHPAPAAQAHSPAATSKAPHAAATAGGGSRPNRWDALEHLRN